jgi:CheY-like chemotaxis protein/GNAT superfamily N-acetyltransferase
MQSAASLIRRLLPESIRLTLAHPEHPVWTRLDPGQLQQIALNLAANARDALEGRGELRIEVTASDAEAQVLFSDDGGGMPPDVLARASHSFFTTKPAHRGTGLGLALVKELTERNRGRLDISSEEGVGTSVRLAFPLDAPASTTSPRGAASLRSVLSTTTALVIDDDLAVRRALVRILEHGGASVVGISGAEELDALPEDFAPTVIILDMVLSGGLGSDLVPVLVARFPGARVLMMTGYAPEEALGSDAPPDVERVLTKPITRRELLDALMGSPG